MSITITSELRNRNVKIKYWYKNSYPHAHDFFELVYVIKGTMMHSLNGGEPTPMSVGDYIFLDYGNYHSFKICDSVNINLAFNSAAISKKRNPCLNINQLLTLHEFSILNTTDIPFPDAKILHDDGTILKLLELIMSEEENPKTFSSNITKNYLVSLLLHILQPFCENYNTHINPLTAKAVSIMTKNFEKSNPLTIAARELNYSPASISLLFQKDFGMSFKEYLQQYRINHAKHLLESTDMKISAVSSAVGYQDQKFFTKVFKELTNQTPSQYRKKQAIPKSVELTSLQNLK